MPEIETVNQVATANKTKEKAEKEMRSQQNDPAQLELELDFETDTGNTGNTGNTGMWRLPIPLSEINLPEVMQLRDEMLPRAIQKFVREKSFSIDNMAPDFLAVSLIVMGAGIIGSNVEIEPKKNDTWRIAATIWSLLVGKASARKTPALSSANSFVDRVKKEVISPQVKKQESVYKIKKKRFDQMQSTLEKDLEQALEQGDDTRISKIADSLAALVEPTSVDRRDIYINDSTIEALTICAQSNPSGLTVVRDELSGLLNIFNQPNRSHERSVYLEAFNGKRNSYVIRRVGREDVTLEQLFVGLLGGIQPDMLKPLITSAMNGQAADGFLERCLQMSVYPTSNQRKVTDCKVSERASNDVFHTFSKLAELNTPREPIVLKFDYEAQKKWSKWSEEALRDELTSPTELESYHVKRLEHCAKLAMTFHLLDEAFKTSPDGEFMPQTTVGIESLNRAMVWMRYLRSHAYRIIASAKNSSSENSPASVLLSRLNKLNGQFTMSQLSTKGWKNLTKAEERHEAIETLLAHGYIKEARILIGSSAKSVKGFVIHPHYQQ
ncbi:hypothetical protein AKJ17_03870 [Vibrio nereis]|uniref:DUF3987 domain-containing protein n=1 Tax=Vibrio nereis TaxID=693 RepID=A0A0M0HS20_VIBNE|nr:hypothetical protein AKJ17_03870 [Vibrio nereis]